MPQGFTLLEALLSVSVVAILALVAFPISIQFQNRTGLDIASYSFTQSLRSAQTLAQASSGDSSWGVKADTGSILLFKGSSYASRDTAYDQISSIYESIILSGVTEVIFAKFTGLPQTTGTLILTSPNNETRSVTINSKGTVSY
ncbi:MAG: Uncharacterized protein G01um101418_910 [Parcubacteria group bacterium Gr01-1014_18]|nr:MAG: Uncharacterized protein Greene041636_889 [Parcubacteria group bacterium Greene0416_36]TSC79746.1 MAG: Uncharacterized protein G01um101418_910 [Parcubacteria group bacterium Gr01-1014_18]TSC97918.1 MAG: Uncharacterized protein Greene101420_953 [Parcubacteria group bacterium Greene1014_20]TSD06576.1 MAG: Uncharacterized protein Greene07142_785 [Parcubacteria group bacterium Greene0714_2]